MKRTIVDGRHLFQMPEFQALITAWKVEPDARGVYRIFLSHKLEEDRARYNSGLFKAFCEKVGIAWEKGTKWVTIEAEEGEQPVVTHGYALEVER